MFFCDYPIIGAEKGLPLFLLGIGQHHCQNHIIRREGYAYPQFFYCTKGSGTMLLDGKKISIPPYTVIFMPASYPHEYYPEEEIWDIHWVIPAGSGIDGILTELGLKEPIVQKLKEVKMLDHIFRKMHDTLRTDSVFGNYRAAGYLYDFIIEFYRLISIKETPNSLNSALLKAVDYINFNFTSHISMDELCSISRVSKQYMCFLFRSALNCRPMEYVTKRRLQAAKELLVCSDKTVEEIAEETGFCTSSYFCKVFKRYEGITPLGFKNAE